MFKGQHSTSDWIRRNLIKLIRHKYSQSSPKYVPSYRYLERRANSGKETGMGCTFNQTKGCARKNGFAIYHRTILTPLQSSYRVLMYIYKNVYDVSNSFLVFI